MRSRWCPGNTPRGTPAPHVPIPPLPTAQGQRAVATVVLPAGDPGHGLSPGLRPRRAEGTPARLRAATPRRQSPPVHGVPQDAPLPLQSANELKFTPRRGWVQLQSRLSEEKGLCRVLRRLCRSVPGCLRAPTRTEPGRNGTARCLLRVGCGLGAGWPRAGWDGPGAAERVPLVARRGPTGARKSVSLAPGSGAPSVARLGPIGTGDRVCLGGVIGSHWFRKESPLVARRGPAGSARGSHSLLARLRPTGTVPIPQSPPKKRPRLRAAPRAPRRPGAAGRVGTAGSGAEDAPRSTAPGAAPPPPDGAGEARRNDRE